MALNLHLATGIVIATATAVSLALAGGSMALSQPAPRELSELAAKARLDSPVASWCRGEFRAGHPGAYAVAIRSATGGGRYLVLESDATVADLASFAGSPDVSCYSPAEARKLNLTIARSDTVQGQVTPRWGTTVVCGFVDNTASVCWQYSPSEKAFVEIGGWVT